MHRRIWTIAPFLFSYAIAHADDTPPVSVSSPTEVIAPATLPDSPSAQLVELQNRLDATERQRSELETRLTEGERVATLLDRYRQENEQLREELEAVRSQGSVGMLGERQQWVLVGGGIALAGFVLGVLMRRRGPRRKEWIN